MEIETETREGLEALATHYHDILRLLGEDPGREGLQKQTESICQVLTIAKVHEQK